MTGYDGNGYNVGDRIELHPRCDLWMRGARYGTVVARIDTPRARVRVRLDARPGRLYSGQEDDFRRID